MVNAIIALLVIGVGIMMRSLYVLNRIFHGLSRMSKRELIPAEIKQMQVRIVEVLFLTFCICNVLMAVSLIAYERFDN